MAATRKYTQVLWSGGDTHTLAVDGEQTSDVITFQDHAIGASIGLKADNQGTPDADSTVEFYLGVGVGDIDASTHVADEYPGDAGSDEKAEMIHLATLNCNDNDPARRWVSLPLPGKNAKLYIFSNDPDNTHICSAKICEVLS